MMEIPIWLMCSPALSPGGIATLSIMGFFLGYGVIDFIIKIVIICRG